MGKVRRNRRLDHGEKQRKRQLILAALAGAVEDVPAPAEYNRQAEENVGGYFTLNRDEIEALVNGDIERIREWAGTLDKRHAAGLLNWLISEGW